MHEMTRKAFVVGCAVRVCVCARRHYSALRDLLAITSGNKRRASEQFYRSLRTFLFFNRKLNEGGGRQRRLRLSRSSSFFVSHNIYGACDLNVTCFFRYVLLYQNAFAIPANALTC